MKEYNIEEYLDAYTLEINKISKLDKNIEIISNEIIETSGKIIITGIGKSGIIGQKFAATLSSLGKSCFFVHAAEAVHGDLGMISKEDMVIMISNSGETSEVVNLHRYIKLIGAKTIAVTSRNESTLAQKCDLSINYDYTKEADRNNLAPTISTTVLLVLLDLIAINVSNKLNFTKNDFHKFHPGGALGAKLESE